MDSSYDYICVLLAQICWFLKVVKEGGSKGCKNGWVSIQQHLLIYFSSYSFTFTLFDCFLLYKKFTPNFATSFDVTRALKAS
jgi:hypothetical protein